MGQITKFIRFDWISAYAFTENLGSKHRPVFAIAICLCCAVLLGGHRAVAGYSDIFATNLVADRPTLDDLMLVAASFGPNADKQAWARVNGTNTCAGYHHYLRTFPKGRYKKAALKALKNCSPRAQRYRGRSNVYFNYFPPYIDPIWPWVLIPEPPVVILPPEEIIPPEEIGPEPELPIAPPPDEIDLLPEQPIAPEPDLPMPEQLPDFDGGGFDGGFDDGGMDFGGFD